MISYSLGWRKSTLIAALMISSLMFSVMPASEANAATYACSNGGMPSRVIGLQYSGVNQNWQDGFATARGRWNSAGVSASITVYSGSPSYMTAANYTNQSWYGLYTPVVAIFGGVGGFSIQVNATTLNNDAPSAQYWTWVLSTSTHELGHALRLNDNPNTTSSTLMSHARNRSTVGSPTAYDEVPHFL